MENEVEFDKLKITFGNSNSGDIEIALHENNSFAPTKVVGFKKRAFYYLMLNSFEMTERLETSLNHSANELAGKY